MSGWAVGSEARRAENYPDPAIWAQLKRQVMIRDKGKCQIRGADCAVIAVDVDHIDPRPPRSHALSNLQAVCKVCHDRKTRRESEAGKTVLDPRPEAVSPGVLFDETDKSSARPRSEWIKDVGPMWEKDSSGEYKLPKHTLGYQVLAWVVRYLRINGRPFMPTGEQARFILWAYAVDERGKWLYRECVKVGPKGLGKDPLLALIACVEVIGPSRFSHWKIDGFGQKTPIARDNPGGNFGISALNFKQNDTTFRYLKHIFSDEARKKFQVHALKDTIEFYGGDRVIAKLSSSGNTKEGVPFSGIAGNELEHWLERNGMHNFYFMMKKNLVKVAGARFWGFSNAYNPSKDSIIQRLDEIHTAWMNGRIADPKLLLDFRQATKFAPYKDVKDRQYVLRELFQEAIFFDTFDMDQISGYFDDTSVPFSETITFYYNCVSVDANAWMDIRDWDMNAVGAPTPDNPQNLPPMGSNIVLGGDGSLNDDCTVLIGKVWGGPLDGLTFPILIIKPENGKPVDREHVDQMVEWAHTYFNVKGFHFDPSHKKDDSDIQFWAPYVDRWHQRYSRRYDRRVWASANHAVNFDMASSSNNRLFVAALDKVQALIVDHTFPHNGDPTLRLHVMNAVRVKKKGYDDHTIGKASPQSSDKIDGAVGMVIAHHVWTKLSNIKKPPTQLTPTSAF